MDITNTTNYEQEMSPSQVQNHQNNHYDELSDIFNNGYSLANGDPELYDRILMEIGEDNQRGKAFSWGKWYYEYERDMSKEAELKKEKQVLYEIQAIRGRGKDKEFDKDRS